MTKWLCILAALTATYAIESHEVAAALVFSEDFSGVANGENLTTSNTSFTYIRIGSGGGVIAALAPGSFSTGSSGIVTQNTSSGSLNGIGVASTLPSSDIYELSLDLRLTDLTGDVVIGVGAGSAFTGNSTFTGNQGLFWLQSDSGNLERRTSSGWSDVGGGTTLALNTNYNLRVLANGSSSPVSYTGGSLAANSMDIYLGGTLLDDDVAVTTPGLQANGFRMYQVSLGNFEVDNVMLSNSVAPVPEPAGLALLASGAAAMVFLRRRSA
ncbi:MAG: hypothetical protein RLZZ440_1184 [Planctomycetota bacterium]|jgi:hypothetical protein